MRWVAIGINGIVPTSHRSRATGPEPADILRGDACSEPDTETPMRAAYVRVLVLEAAILVALWIVGRLYS
jgi:hypothetical protein